MMSSDSLSFFMPWAVAVNSSGIVYVADTRRNVIREITRSGETKIIAGKLYELTNTAGFTDGPATLALFNSPAGIAVDNLGNVYVGDYGNHLIRKITPNGFVTTIAGSAGVTGSTNGPATTALFNSPYGVAVGSSGNVYVTDINNRLIRKISGGIVSVLSGSGKKGDANGKGIDASFGAPSGVAVDSVGNVYVADTSNNMIRKITRRGVVIAFAGSGKKGSKNGIGMAASFNSPYGIAVDSSGNVYVADTGNNLIREITSWGLVSTLAGSGSIGSKNGTGSTASFNRPRGIAVDSSGTVYVADTWNNLIRKIR